MFERIKDALNKPTTSGGQFENIMKFPEGHTYTLRLLPTIEEGKDPLFHHWVNSWISKSTGKFVSTLSLKTFGERDPISELRWKLFKEWKSANPKVDNKEYVGDIAEKEQWLINVYVVDDPHTPENNGTVKILRLGPQIKEIIDKSTEGERAEAMGLGWDIFNPTAGFDLKIVAEKQGQYTTFKDSYFSPKKNNILSEEDVEKLYENLHDLTSIYTVKTYDELVSLLDDHFFCNGETKSNDIKKISPPAKSESKKAGNTLEEEDKIPFLDDPEDSVGDIDELLDGLDLDKL